jgi:glycosidase
MPNAKVLERSVKEINLKQLTAELKYYPSPASWEDQTLYFLLLDRFSDGKEYEGFADLEGKEIVGPTPDRKTPLYGPGDEGTVDPQTWFKAGQTWCGGSLKGLKDKLGYLKRLGITAVWLSPIFKQVAGSNDYHGYGIQNFLEVDPHFGTREELRDLTHAAHQAGIRVILDIILNHAGDVFAYPNRNTYYYFQGTRWDVQGYRKSKTDGGSLPFAANLGDAHPEAWPDGAVWPQELQDPKTWGRQGEIRNWDNFPEYLDGDFCCDKDIDHGPAPKDPGLAWDVLRRIREFRNSAALTHLCEVYKFWIAFADLDGYRLDTVKHMEPGAVRYFANVIHEFAQSLGKENFYLIGEVAGGRAHAVNIVDTTGLDAALGIEDLQDKLEFLAKGWRNPGNPDTPDQEGYFDLFNNSLPDGKSTHQWFGKHIITMFDDHDQIGATHKFRFCGNGNGRVFLKVALGINLTSCGIPCIYYGTEQALNGADPRTGDADKEFSDVYLRETMFGGKFGAMRSTGRHFFNKDHEAYKFISELCKLRREHPALCRGRQYLRKVSATGAENDFHYPQMIGDQLQWVVAWSRLFVDQEYLCAVNTDPAKALDMWVTVDHNLNPPGNQMKCLFSTEPAQLGSSVAIETRNGSAIRITVPPAGFVIYRQND